MVGLPKSIIKKYGITKKAWAVFRGRSGSKSSRKARHSKGGKRTTMAKKSRRRASSFLSTNSLFKYVRIGALVAPAVGGFMADAPLQDKVEGVLSLYTGYHPRYGDFRWDRLAKGWTPFVASVLVTYGIQKAAGMLRRL